MRRLSLILPFLFLAVSLVAQPVGEWQQLDAGLEVATFNAGKPSPTGKKQIQIVRIDPAHWEFKLMAAANHGKRARTAPEWAKEFGLTALVNAGMFQMDGITNVGYMKVNGKVLNGHINDDNTIIVFGTDDPKLPQMQIIDRECQDWKKLLEKYQNATQGIRMVDCKGANRWSQQPRKWSMVVMGYDKQGRALMVACRSPYTVHDFIDILLGLNLDLRNCMYLEGGPETSLYLNTPDCHVEVVGSFETGFFESDLNDRAWPIPNVIGIVKR